MEFDVTTFKERYGINNPNFEYAIIDYEPLMNEVLIL